MAYTDFIAVIDLGTAHMVGMVGTKNPAGVMTIIAHEVENSATSIRRGCVYNVEETASKIKRLVLKLENKLGGSKIGKVYVGIGGQSLRTIDHSVFKVLGAEGVVTEEIIEDLYKECRNFHPDMLDVLATVSPTYFVDDKQEDNPVGIPCNRIEARYKLVVGRPSLKRYVINSISERAKIEIADIIVSPLALADVVLSDDEKNLGCAMIGFGAGVTSLTVFKGGKLIGLSVIPLGGHLITRDITSLRLVEAEAERVKVTYGSALVEKDNDAIIQVSSAEGLGLREIKLAELNNIVEARMKEILENVFARLEAMEMAGELGAGIVITGGGSALKNLPAAIKDRLNVDVRYASIRKGLVQNDDMLIGRTEYTTAVGLLKQGTQNCAIYAPPVTEIPKEEIPEEQTTSRAPQGGKEKKGRLFDRLTKGFDNLGKSLFDEDNM